MPPPSNHQKSIDRLLPHWGICSRTQARQAVAAGRVTVNHQVLLDPDTWVDVGLDQIHLDGNLLSAQPKATWMLHKPLGYVTTRVDHRARPTVCELLPAHLQWLAPVGRLDLDTSGLLLFTNDGGLARAILDPHSKLEKAYIVRCSAPLQQEHLDRLAAGVDIGDGAGPTRPAQAERICVQGHETTIRLVIHEGRNRQVRRMVRAVRAGVLALHRERIGPLTLGDLPVGQARAVREDELDSLRTALAQAKRGERAEA